MLTNLKLLTLVWWKPNQRAGNRQEDATELQTNILSAQVREKLPELIEIKECLAETGKQTLAAGGSRLRPFPAVGAQSDRPASAVVSRERSSSSHAVHDRRTATSRLSGARSGSAAESGPRDVPAQARRRSSSLRGER